ncbi:oxidized low-density lipoprotein receptor 1-like isoform X2 [Brachyhypopomus gauderio]|uniref:oxidized low-density lipoprotein receptor 1-like isoform X2 n=1 Tax=Brachyhypopomus gauderio TaxID=698409 RepID=UPI004042A76D
MDNEVTYSSVVFNRSIHVKSEAVTQPEQETVYSDVRRQAETPSHNCSEPTAESPTANARGSSLCLDEDAVTSPSAPHRRATVCLGVLCVLLLAGLVTTCVFNIIQVSQHSTLLALYTQERSAHQTLRVAKMSLERENEDLAQQRDELNTTLRFITQFSKIPAKAFCQLIDGEIHCEPCLRGWIQYGSNCYFFYTGPYTSWLSWHSSRQHCLKMEADLVIIDNIEEQEFINQNAPNYFDEYHGYWIGLSLTNEKKWVWTNGSVLDTGFWIGQPQISYGACVLSKTGDVTLQSWTVNTCQMLNRWICEMNAVPWPRPIKHRAPDQQG